MILNARNDRADKAYRTAHPVGHLQLIWGRYSYIDSELAGAPCRFFHLPGHSYQAQVYLEDIRDRQEETRRNLGAFTLS